jgi:hypothetical protein
MKVGRWCDVIERRAQALHGPLTTMPVLITMLRSTTNTYFVNEPHTAFFDRPDSATQSKTSAYGRPSRMDISYRSQSNIGCLAEDL